MSIPKQERWSLEEVASRWSDTLGQPIAVKVVLEAVQRHGITLAVSRDSLVQPDGRSIIGFLRPFEVERLLIDGEVSVHYGLVDPGKPLSDDNIVDLDSITSGQPMHVTRKNAFLSHPHLKCLEEAQGLQVKAAVAAPQTTAHEDSEAVSASSMKKRKRSKLGTDKRWGSNRKLYKQAREEAQALWREGSPLNHAEMAADLAKQIAYRTLPRDGLRKALTEAARDIGKPELVRGTSEYRKPPS